MRSFHQRTDPRRRSATAASRGLVQAGPTSPVAAQRHLSRRSGVLWRSRTEQHRAESYVRGAEADRDLEVGAHAHGQLVEPIACRIVAYHEVLNVLRRVFTANGSACDVPTASAAQRSNPSGREYVIPRRVAARTVIGSKNSPKRLLSYGESTLLNLQFIDQRASDS